MCIHGFVCFFADIERFRIKGKTTEEGYPVFDTTELNIGTGGGNHVTYVHLAL
ncbi:hypothetical protein K493DRAFT_318397, partial [Basidiobolus meristosporus CBS 931.73]